MTSDARERPTYVYKLKVTLPEGSNALGWEPDDWQGWDPDATHVDPDEPGFSWPSTRLYLSQSGANARARLFRKYGAAAEVVRSEPVEWVVQP